MKISMVIVEGAKQIMLTPETDHEKEVLGYISPSDKLEVVSKRGTFIGEYEHAQLQLDMCRGEYLRAFSSEDSLMFLIKDQKEAQNEN